MMGQFGPSVLQAELSKLMKPTMEYQNWRPLQLSGPSSISGSTTTATPVMSIQILEALHALLNTPHPSGKLAMWGMALQELDLRLHYRPGKVNKNADALSRGPVETTEDTERVVAALPNPQATNKDREKDITLAKQ